MTNRVAKRPAVATGTLNGRVITLDAPVPGLEGRRVRMVLRPAEDVEVVLAAGDQALLWQHWVNHGEQGPLSDDEPDFP